LSSITAEGGATPHIDPRMRARRIAVLRGHGQRRLQRVIDLGLLLAVAAGFAISLRSPLLDVGEIQVSGTEHADPDAVRAALGVAVGDPLMDVDLGAAGKAVAALPWVQAVELHRGIDGTVQVQVTERQPVAIAGEAGEEVLIDADGVVLGPADTAPAALATLVRLDDVVPGAPGTAVPTSTTDSVALAARLAEVAPGLVAAVSVDGREVVATLVQGGRVRFGDLAQLDGKVRSLRTVLEQVDLHCLGEIDVRLPGNPVLTREEGCS